MIVIPMTLAELLQIILTAILIYVTWKNKKNAKK